MKNSKGESLPDLDEFITTSLEQIVSGVNGAQDSLPKYGAVIKASPPHPQHIHDRVRKNLENEYGE